ncbi:hypothetical protein [Candidatus Contubernalis alkaliaceticus]|nr:hypothetical protein [Candidatus Contubernalis alkalaceticus]UNC92169.1 hypothetical protein HUE98_08730 [Candidatus Contubernalis alkalaceticus]
MAVVKRHINFEDLSPEKLDQLTDYVVEKRVLLINGEGVKPYRVQDFR